MLLLDLATGFVRADSLYVGDFNDDSVKRFDAATGAFLDTFVAPASGGLTDIRGLIFDRNHNLLVAGQFVGQDRNGEVFQYSGSDGSLIGSLVPEPTAPLAPGMMVLGPDELLYVADTGAPNPVDPAMAVPGGISRYNATTGAFIDKLTVPAADLGVAFHPRGLVFGTDGLLYASNFEAFAPVVEGQPNPNLDKSGSIVRFDPGTGDYVGEFVARDASPLLRADGIAFSPDGDLFAVSFRFDANDTDKILQFDGDTGDLVKAINLDEVGQPRSSAQGLLFGPGGDLFVPSFQTGEIRRYDLTTGDFQTFVAADGTLVTPWYLTFGNTDPTTLSYIPEPASVVLLGLGGLGLLSLRRFHVRSGRR